MCNPKWSLQLPDSWDYPLDLCKTPPLEEGGSCAAHLHANSAITPTFFTKASHRFTSFNSRFSPVHPPSSSLQRWLSLSSSAPSLPVSFAPSAAFYSLFRNQSAPGEKTAAHFVSLFVSIHSPSLAFLIFSLTLSFPFTKQSALGATENSHFHYFSS